MRGFMSSSKDYAADTLDKKKKPRLAKPPSPRRGKLPKDTIGKVASMPKVTAIKVKPIKTAKMPSTSPSKRKKNPLSGL